ncbi:MAG: phage integrase N-terminal SAM-like domain-containing protein [Methylococcales bacterium]
METTWKASLNYWIKRFILFHHKRHPSTMGKAEIEQFLTHLAVDCRVAASTQNLVLCAGLGLSSLIVRSAMAAQIAFSVRHRYGDAYCQIGTRPTLSGLVLNQSPGYVAHSCGRIIAWTNAGSKFIGTDWSLSNQVTVV